MLRDYSTYTYTTKFGIRKTVCTTTVFHTKISELNNAAFTWCSTKTVTGRGLVTLYSKRNTLKFICGLV